MKKESVLDESGRSFYCLYVDPLWLGFKRRQFIACCKSVLQTDHISLRLSDKTGSEILFA